MDALLEQIKQASSSLDRAARRKAIDSLRKAADSLEDPVDTVFRMGHLELEKAAVQLGYDLDTFSYLVKAQGSKTTEEIAHHGKAEEQLMRRLLRYFASANLVQEVGVDEWEANQVTRNLSNELTEAAILHYYGIVSQQSLDMPEFLKNNGYKTPSDDSNTIFHHSYKTKLSPFEWMAQTKNKEQLELFHKFMALRRQANLTWLTVYPVRQEIGQSADLNPERALYVNMGGSIGHQCAQFKEKYPDIPGRVILQDLPEVVAQAMNTPGVENMGHDFFNLQPVKGAKFYFMRGVSHNHPTHKVKLLFTNIREAMAPDSVLLLDEIVLPPKDVDHVSSAMDLIMMGAFAAEERTEIQWRELAASAGLKITNVYLYNPIENEAVMELRLAESV
ncbi:hypothetical protein MCOR25_002291 [Pyricularia grisea]|nr:hypothetical protein MCOR25_002291 [Pyricularia grisea]